MRLRRRCSRWRLASARIHGSYWSDNRAAKRLREKEEIHPEDIDPSAFIEDQRIYLERMEEIEDDGFHTAIPLASIPWMEAILGCPIVRHPGPFHRKETL